MTLRCAVCPLTSETWLFLRFLACAQRTVHAPYYDSDGPASDNTHNTLALLL